MKKCIYLFLLLCLLSAGSILPMEKKLEEEAKLPVKLNWKELVETAGYILVEKDKAWRHLLNMEEKLGKKLREEAKLSVKADWEEFLENAENIAASQYSGSIDPLNEAARKADFLVVQCLIKVKKIAVDKKCVHGFTPLHCAASLSLFLGEEEKLKVIKCLVNAGADVNKGQGNSSYGLSNRTALHYAAGGGCLKIVKYLIGSGANVKAKDEGGWTPLHCAANHEQLEVFKFLVLMGANFSLKDNEGETPLDLFFDDEDDKKLNLFNKWWKENKGWLNESNKLKLEYFKTHESLELKDFKRWSVPRNINFEKQK